ncbi:ZapG family protein [Shewanella youngdeokensis]|uniref:DUF1043 family protein n=1 Tax=Shewanella youngdeokensis TaxID=2999068 RepID=A0ABZ0JWI6_9GAMM|nr:DUF1043 family protein [Shewanella sp. DAU334]
MEWALTFAAFIIGSVFGYVGHSVVTRNNKDKSQNKQLEQTQLELSQYKQEVSDHVDDHYKQLTELTHLLNKVNVQWSASATSITATNSNNSQSTLEAIDPPNTIEDSTYTEKAASI